MTFAVDWALKHTLGPIVKTHFRAYLASPIRIFPSSCLKKKNQCSQSFSTSRVSPISLVGCTKPSQCSQSFSTSRFSPISFLVGCTKQSVFPILFHQSFFSYLLLSGMHKTVSVPNPFPPVVFLLSPS